MTCPNCKEGIVQTPGKRTKVFCNSTCRSNFWQKEDRKARRPKLPVQAPKEPDPAPIVKPKWIVPEPKEKMPEGLSYIQQLTWKSERKKKN